MRRERVALFVAAALLIAGAGTALFLRAAGRAEAVAQQDAPTLDESASEAASPAPAIAPAARQREPVAAGEAKVAPAVRTGARTLRGRVTVRETDGVVLPPVDGTMHVSAWEGETGLGGAVAVAIASGRFAASLAAAAVGCELEFSDLLIHGRYAALESPAARIAFPESQEVELLARIARPSVLRVHDHDSGAELRDVVLARGTHRDTHPGAEIERAVIARDLVSPIALDALRDPVDRIGQSTCWVGAPGYAWGRVVFDFVGGGERAVSLVRGGDLEIAVTGADPNAPAELCLFAEERQGRPSTTVPLVGDGKVTLRGLVPARYRIEAQLGAYYGEPKVLGRANVEVRAGELSSVSLELQGARAVAPSSARGIVYVPKDWARSEITLSLETLDTPQPGISARPPAVLAPATSDRPGYDAFRWQCDGVQRGSYLIVIREPQFSVVAVLDGSAREHVLVVPPPAVLRLTVVDDATGAAVDCEVPLWNPTLPEGIRGGWLDEGQRGEGPGRFVVTAPACEIEVTLWTAGFQPYEETIDLTRGSRDATVRLQRASGIELRLADGDVAVPIPEDWHRRFVAAEGAGEVTLTTRNRLWRRYLVSEPGRYTIVPPRIPGYLQAPEQSVDVSLGAMTVHVVQLEREHR